jgi:hypothetical protein
MIVIAIIIVVTWFCKSRSVALISQVGTSALLLLQIVISKKYVLAMASSGVKFMLNFIKMLSAVTELDHANRQSPLYAFFLFTLCRERVITYKSVCIKNSFVIMLI